MSSVLKHWLCLGVVGIKDVYISPVAIRVSAFFIMHVVIMANEFANVVEF